MTQKISFPKTTVNKLPATLSAGVEGQKILVLGQKTSTGSAIAETLIKGVSKADINTKFGQGSMLAGQLNSIFKIFTDSQSDKLPRVDVIAMDDAGAGVVAESTITITGTGNASTDGVLKVKICGTEYSLTITEGDTISELGALLNTEITNADNPFSNAETGNIVTLTARNKGTIANDFPISMSGVSLDGSDYKIGNITVVITAFTSGATNPTMTDVFDVIEEERYQTINAPIQLGTDYITTLLDNRFNVTNDILDGVYIGCQIDTLSALKVVGNALNSQSVVIIGDRKYADGNNLGGALKEIDYIVSAQVSAVRALRKTEGSNIVNITPAVANGSLDGEGGIAINSLPYANTPLNDLEVIETGLGFSKVEAGELNETGISILGNNKVDNIVLLGEIFTTYKTDVAGNEDTTWKFLNTVDEMSASAEYIFVNFKKRFVQSRLTAGSLKAGRNVANEQVLKSYMLQLFIELGDELIGVEGKEAEDYFFKNLVLTIDYVNGKVDINSSFPIVVQLRELLINLKTQFGL